MGGQLHHGIGRGFKAGNINHGLGTAAAIQERGGVYLIGVDTDWTVSAPDYADITFTSVLKRLELSVQAASRAVATAAAAALGEIAGAEAVHVTYRGSALKAATRYGWTVTVWTRAGETLTGGSWFETGLMDPSPSLTASQLSR